MEEESFLSDVFSYENVEFVTYMYLIPIYYPSLCVSCDRSDGISIKTHDTVCIPGILLAVLSAIVFAKLRQTSLEVLLCGLSLFDVILLTSSMTIYPSMHACSKEEDRTASLTCHFFWKSTLIIWPLSLMAQAGSVWTCVSITIDRYIAVSYPIKKRVWCTPFTSLKTLILITIFSALFKLPSFFEVRLDENGEIRMTWLRQNAFYIEFYVFYLYVALIQLIPWTAIIILNAVVIQKVRIAYRAQALLVQGKTASSKRDESERKVTVMAIVMTGIFIVCNIPPGINNLVDHLDVSYKSVFRQRLPLSNLLVCVNSASNVFIYCVFNKKFRDAALKLVGLKSPKRGTIKNRSIRKNTTNSTNFRTTTSDELLPTQC